jgi:hypothetical protein
VNNTARGTISNALPTANKDRDMHQYIWEVIYIFFIHFSHFPRCKRGHNAAQPTEWAQRYMSIVVAAFRCPTGVNAWE